MKKSVKAALLSALVFPGSGHFMLKSRMRGFILCAVSLGCVAFLMNHAMQQAFSVMDSLQTSLAAGASPQAMTNALTSADQGEESITVKLASWAVMGCWIFAVIDAYRLGKEADKVS